MVASPTGQDPRMNVIVNDRPILFQRGCYRRTMTAGVILREKNVGLTCQGARRQDELIGGKPPVV
jgi:hypothetical protein